MGQSTGLEICCAYFLRLYPSVFSASSFSRWCIRSRSVATCCEALGRLRAGLVTLHNAVIEDFNLEYEHFFDEPSYQVRWDRLKKMYAQSYPSFRVLFVVETMGLLDTWKEPTSEELNRLLRHKIAGGQIAIRIGNVIDLFRPVWPLEIAKCEFLVYRATADRDFRRKYFLTGIRSASTALVQIWWAFETLMNDFASIIAAERRTSLDPVTLALLEEKRPAIDRTGAPSLEPYFQPVLQRFQLIYRVLTGETLDRGSSEWQRLDELKNNRDTYVHRIGKKPGDADVWDDATLVNGFSTARDVLARVLTKTPEFASKFAYKYLAFWSCGTESPFIWDGNEGAGFYLGLADVKSEAVVNLYAPVPRSFSPTEDNVASTAHNPEAKS
jgi:hypothetical protein